MKTSHKRTLPLTPLEAALVDVMQRRDTARRWHPVKRRQRKTTVERSAKGTRRPEAA